MCLAMIGYLYCVRQCHRNIKSLLSHQKYIITLSLDVMKWLIDSCLVKARNPDCDSVTKTTLFVFNNDGDRPNMMSESTPPVAYRWIILLACMLATFMAAIEVTIVSTALPTIITDLGGFQSMSWVFSAYLLTQAITIPLYGRMTDLYGRKSMFYIGVSLFLIGSIMCGFASSMLWLILSRGLQGLGAGAITPIATTIIADIYSVSERPKAQGYISSVWGVSAILGPLAGAFIIQHFHWSFIFWVNVPIGCLCIALVARFLPAVPKQTGISLDLTGTLYLFIFVISFLLLLLQADTLHIRVTLLLLGISCIGLWLLIKQQRRAIHPLFPLELWRNRYIFAGNLGSLAMGATMMGVSVFLPTFVQAVMQGTPLQAGTTLALVSIGWPLASMLSNKVLAWISYRMMAILGGVLLTLGCIMLIFLSAESSLLQVKCAAFLIGAGLGFCNMTFLISVQNAAGFNIRGIATASTMFSRQLGAALGAAILGVTLNLSLRYWLPEVADPIQLLMECHNALGQECNLTFFKYITQNVTISLQTVFLMAAVISLATIVTAFLIPSEKKVHN